MVKSNEMQKNFDDASSSVESEGEEVNIISLLIILAKRKKIVLGLPVVACLLSVIYSLTLPNIFTATTRILPPREQQSSVSAMLGALAGGAGAALGVKSPNDVYAAMLASRTVADNLIMRFKLMDYYEEPLLSRARLKLVGVTKITAGKDGVITIDVDDKDPKRAADMANAYVDELYKLSQSIAVSEASQRRLFFEGQLKLAKENLTIAEIARKQTQESTGVLELSEQSKGLIGAVGSVRAQISAKEVQLAAMRVFATERNPDYQQGQQELAGLRAQLAKLEKGGEGGLVPTGKLPEVGLENIRRFRDVKYYEALYEILYKQFEMAKIDEAKSTTLVQVLDRAVLPDTKSKPKRLLMVILVSLVSGLFGIILAFVKEASENARRNPEQANRLALLHSYLKWRP